MSKINETTASYKNALNNWHTKAFGPKVTVEQLAAAHALGLRPGKQALQTAMRMRDDGATTAQMLAAASAAFEQSGTANNVITKQLEPAKLVTQVKVKNSSNHTVYKVSLTDKGKAKVAAALADKAPAKVTKAKARVEKPAVVPATVTPAPAVTPEVPQA